MYCTDDVKVMYDNSYIIILSKLCTIRTHHTYTGYMNGHTLLSHDLV